MGEKFRDSKRDFWKLGGKEEVTDFQMVHSR